MLSSLATVGNVLFFACCLSPARHPLSNPRRWEACDAVLKRHRIMVTPKKGRSPAKLLAAHGSATQAKQMPGAARDKPWKLAAGHSS